MRMHSLVWNNYKERSTHQPTTASRSFISLPLLDNNAIRKCQHTIHYHRQSIEETVEESLCRATGSIARCLVGTCLLGDWTKISNVRACSLTPIALWNKCWNSPIHVLMNAEKKDPQKFAILNCVFDEKMTNQNAWMTWISTNNASY